MSEISNNLKVVSILVTILLSLIGLLITYLNKLKLSRRADYLKYVNKQLEEFYGPLFIVAQTGRILYGAYEKKSRELNDEDRKKEWRAWISCVFINLNSELFDIIIKKGYLIREDYPPECLLQFCAHSASYNVIKKKWDNDDYSETISVIPFPVDIEKYAKDSYHKIKAEQLDLIKKTK